MSNMPLHEAIKAACGARRQVDLAIDVDVDQTTISRWLRGKGAPPNLEQLAAIEDATGKPRGWILHASNLIADVTTVEEAVAMDPDLSDVQRNAIIDSYRGMVARSRSERGRPDLPLSRASQ